MHFPVIFFPVCWIYVTDIERRSQNSYTAPSNDVVSNGQSGVFGFLSPTHAERNANKMRPWSSRAVRCFTCVYLHAPDESRLFWSRKKTRIPQLEPYTGIKGSPIYICRLYSTTWVSNRKYHNGYSTIRYSKICFI